jgi:hypothetical protein
VTTSFPQEPADEIRAMLEDAERNFAQEAAKLKAERNQLIAEGWRFETSFDAWFSSESAAREATEALAQNGYDVKRRDDDARWLTVPVYLPLDEPEFDEARRAIDAVVAPFGGGVETSEIDLDRRRRPRS